MSKIKSKRFGKGESCRRIYLIAPRHPNNFWTLQGVVDIMGSRTLMPNAALATLIALTDDDIDVEYILCDENVSDIDWNMPCDLVAITGGTIHEKRIRELCFTFKEKGKQIALGGSFASINHNQCDGLADYLFIGEAEYLWPMFLRQWMENRAKPVYIHETFINMKDSPAPDWSLINAGDYTNINIQTSRGCPHRCDFCDVIQYVGNRYRTKSIEQVLTEVKNAHEIGARYVFFSDDNFLGNKRFTKELLSALIEWNNLQARPLSFSTQITINVADDDDLLRMFADAGFYVLFIGVETVRKESLEEIHKGHNVKYDIAERIKRISRYGIVPFIGLIVGFDNDDITIFEDLYQFIENTSSPIAGISLLNAPKKTPLYERLKKEGRLMGDDFSGEWQLFTNVIPKNMSYEVLIKCYWELFRKIYEPDLFEKRLKKWLENVEYFPEHSSNKKCNIKHMYNFLMTVKYIAFEIDSAMRNFFVKNIAWTLRKNPRLIKTTLALLTYYSHFYDFVKNNAPDTIENVELFDKTPHDMQRQTLRLVREYNENT
ncbi:MAG: B12-binding domain-containing radical SAM protein [Candidatus Scalindua sp.]|nr:B12-binding domain-containing radical SAM protein [Candidatus Scalindua sp.]